MSRRLQPEDEAYPAGLRALARPPAVYLRGEWPLPGRAVALVGARRCSGDSERLAFLFARGLAQAGVLVVSGGALGVDAAAHEGALAEGGRTLVVLPTPLDRPAPAANRALFRRVLEGGGAWLSELPHGAALGRHSFCARNRLIAALAELVVVVEAHARSGTRYTVEAARRLGRGLAAVPFGVQDPRGDYARQILRAGGRAVETAEDLLGLLGLYPPSAAPRSSPLELRAAPRGRPPGEEPGRLEPEGRVLAILAQGGPASLEALARALGEPAALVAQALVELELRGEVRRLPLGPFARVG